MNAISAKRTEFTRALDLAASVIERRNVVPILDAVKVSANGALRFEATNLDTTASAEIAYEGPEEEAFALMSARAIKQAVNAARADFVSFARVESKVEVESGPFKAKVGSLPGGDHPGAHRLAQPSFAVDVGSDVLDAIARIVPAISTEETRYYLNGICIWKVGDWLYRLAATDGHRLMIADVALPGGEGAIPDRAIIPREFIGLMLRHFAKSKEPIRLTFAPGLRDNGKDKDLAPEPMAGCQRVSVRSRLGAVDFTLASKLIDGTYPEVERVIPTGPTCYFEADRAAFLRALECLSPMANGKVRALKLSAVGEGIEVSSDCPDIGKAKIVVTGKHNLPGGYAIGFNGRYLRDALVAARGEVVRFELGDSGSPALIRDPADTAFFSVLMPMRV